MTRLQLTDLTLTYPGAGGPAVDRLNLTVESGQICALLGPSGCGKTTVLKLIAGLLPPSSGDIRLDGASVLPVRAERRGAVMVFQNALLFPYMSVGDNVGFALRMRGEAPAAMRGRIEEMLDLVQLPGLAGRRPRDLSGGQQQRVALARALIAEPKVLLLDEPLSNLDADLRDGMRGLIRRVQRQLGVTTIFVTHDQEEAVVMADRIALMFGGGLHQEGAPQVFYDRPASERVARFFGNPNFLAGRYERGRFETAAGGFDAPYSAIDAGRGVLTIRPENIRLVERTGGIAPNQVEARVLARVYAGTHANCRVALGDGELAVVTAADQVLGEGDTIRLHLPPEKIWILPPVKA